MVYTSRDRPAEVLFSERLFARADRCLPTRARGPSGAERSALPRPARRREGSRVAGTSRAGFSADFPTAARAPSLPWEVSTSGGGVSWRER